MLRAVRNWNKPQLNCGARNPKLHHNRGRLILLGLRERRIVQLKTPAGSGVGQGRRFYFPKILLINLAHHPDTGEICDAQDITSCWRETPADVNLAALREAIKSVAGVSDVHDLHVWSLTSGVNAMSVHTVLYDDKMHDEVFIAVQKKVTSEFNIAHATVQVECQGCSVYETHL